MAVLFAFVTALMVVIFVFLNICRIKRLRLEERAGDGPGHWASNGLDFSVLETFPVFTYSEVAANRVDTGPLECAVCLSLFEEDEDEEMRLLPKCNHVFHVSCVDAWLKHHSTCPLCRTDLHPVSEEFIKPDSGQQVSELGGREGPEINDHVVLEVRGDIEEGQLGRYKRWKSMGDVADVVVRVDDEECWKRFTLNLSNNLGEESGKFKRTRYSF